ncbi:MAG: GGDEF domain-containing protein [Solirubrobacteraceae bacterium]
MLVFRDLSGRRELERNLRRLAYTDPLTGLPNRTLFYDRLGQALVMSTRHNAPLAVLYVDLDGFKAINDSFGHEVGDKLLAAVAVALRGCLRGQDTLARLGGDEFAVLLPEIADPQHTALVAEKLLAALRDLQLAPGERLTAGASIGVALFPRDGRDVTHLLRSADKAMYRAKARGGDQVQLYAPLLGEPVARDRPLEAERGAE